MPIPLFDPSGERGWLDIGSYARRGPERCDRLSLAQVEFIARTVHRSPEVMVKVLNRGGRNLAAVRRHFKYLDRDGELVIDTEDGQRLQGKGAEEVVLDDWDVDLDAERPTAELKPRARLRPPRLVQKLVFSMPAGTPPSKVLAAVKNFAREEFALRHRYAMVLHTDEPHPHVHLVVKALGEDGRRLNIRRATLRGWRREYARHLREQGVAANATERVIRGETTPRKADGIHRAALRGVSSHWRQRATAVAEELARHGLTPEVGKARMLETRRQVISGWKEVASDLVLQDRIELAKAVHQFAARMPPLRTEKEIIAASLTEKSRSQPDRQITR